MQMIKVPQLAWHKPRDLELAMPDDWQVQICHMDGHHRPELTVEEILKAVSNPIGTKPLSELARGKKEVVIVFDDMTRVTRVAKIVPVVLEELIQAGIHDDNIRFICSLGLHGAMYRSDFVKKLGEEVVTRFRVYNHNPFGNCIYVGTTNTFKTRVHINEEYIKCDLKIVIGSCVPHPVAGFGGGSKNIMPGIASFDTIDWHHKVGGARIDPVCADAQPTQGMGIVPDNNLFKRDINEATELVGIDFLINTIPNLWGEPVAVYAGQWQQSYSAAVQDARKHFRTPPTTDKDIVISNNYAKANESMIGLASAIPLVDSRGGDIVVIANAPEGQVTHYLTGPFGKTSFAVQYSQCDIPAHVYHVIAYNEYPHRGSSWFEDHDKIVYMSRWKNVLESLQRHHGARASVAVIPDATNQFFSWCE